MYLVYSLRNPKNRDEVHWVGQTQMDRFVDRYKEYLNLKSDNLEINEWILELRKHGDVPLFEPVERVATKAKALEREAYWIDQYRKIGMPLKNRVYPSTLPRPLSRYKKIKVPKQIKIGPIRDSNGQVVKALFRQQAITLYAHEHVPRAEILKKFHLGTVPYYGWLKTWLDEYDKQHRKTGR